MVTVLAGALVMAASPSGAAAGPGTARPDDEAALEAPQRYVDAVFPDVTRTEGLGFATVTDVQKVAQTLFVHRVSVESGEFV